MNSKERVMNSINFRKVDRIAKFDSYWEEFETNCKKRLNLQSNVDLYDYFDVDLSIVVPDESPYPGIYQVLSEQNDQKLFRNRYGALVKSKANGYFEEEIEFLINEPEDLDKYPFEPASLESRYIDFQAKVASEKAKGRCVFGKIGGPFIRSTFIRGKVNFLMDIAGDEGFAKELAGRVGDLLLEIGKTQLQKGDLYDTGIWIFDDMAFNKGPLCSPKSFETIFLPIYKKLVGELKKAGAAKVGFHSDGDIRLLLDMLIDAGIDTINPVEPRAGMSIKELLKKYGRKIAYIGGMCNSEVLINGPKTRIIDQAREIIELARDGGVIIGAHSIGPDIPVENYLAYINYIKENGSFGD